MWNITAKPNEKVRDQKEEHASNKLRVPLMCSFLSILAPFNRAVVNAVACCIHYEESQLGRPIYGKRSQTLVNQSRPISNVNTHSSYVQNL